MKKILEWTALLAALLALVGCTGKEAEEPRWEESLYRTVVYNSGEDESDAKYLEIAQRSQKLLSVLEEKAGAFVMDAYNYQSVDDEGTPLYTMNNPEVPIEIAPAGMSVQVSREYFKWNPIETANGSDLAEQIVQDDLTLNLLVPEQYRDMEQEILAAWREYFYFEKVEAENDYNEMAGEKEQLDIAEDQLAVNIIYVKDGQRYFTYRSDCASADGNWITDPLVQIYTGNIHCNYAHSFLTQ
ncbi:MAG: hypothetical protein OSJ71_16725, partial [Acetatifactor sp.]|nr:hypothetical protein [Acetatifactor sp.]